MATKSRTLRSVTPQGPTLSIRSTINIGGLAPRQEAVVENNEYSRGLVAGGLWTLLVAPETLVEAVTEPITGSGDLETSFGEDLAQEA